MNLDDLNEKSKAFWFSPTATEEPAFDSLWPTETKGDGKVVKNNAKTGAAQGKSSLVRKSHCVLCGFPNDLSRIDHSGGSLDGEGAAGAISTQTVSAPVSGGGTHTEPIGTQAYRNASGCALCFSKNNTPIRRDVAAVVDAWSRLRLTGF